MPDLEMWDPFGYAIPPGGSLRRPPGILGSAKPIRRGPMPLPKPEFTIGIEEEYLLIDPETRELVRDPPADLMTESEEQIEGQVGPEFLRSQIEVGTKICSTIQEARDDLGRLRRAVVDVAAKHGLVPIAASTHPFASWREQLTTDRERYTALARDMRTVMRRLLVCGMHVHVGVSDDDLRIDLMNQMTYFLPHLLALSCSSPFWHGVDTGLQSYRKVVFKGPPRTGLPEQFSSWSEYQRHVNVLVETGCIEDASKVWWDIRPSVRYPTLEMRVADICTNIDDGLTIAALYVCLLSMLYRRRTENQRWRSYANMLVDENMWLAQRDGVSGSLIDFGKSELVPYRDLMEELIELIREDAEELDCVDEIEHVREIVRRGTSADHQLETYRTAVAGGADDHQAFNAVVDWVRTETVAGI
jgi:carboxylate-amine ligase